MQNSGTKLVLALAGLALLLGATSWWYRYEAAHRASQFWGAEASRLIAESENLEAIHLVPHAAEPLLIQIQVAKPTDLSRARGQAHLRHAFLSDRNYVWDEPLDSLETQWRWCLRFFDENGDEDGQQAHVLLSEDLRTIGKLDFVAKRMSAFSCEPMTASLKQYFEAQGLLALDAE